ncbi:hypothetical protein [uncultured Tolumonas sp.]|uniref:hypothetical protein n=1 Tax=uncultured Tolumonas sp. TaxID=263765 RepID=UPI002931F11A|nr:hypothetical protein [uncultured Tolumonas sp.]
MVFHPQTIAWHVVVFENDNQAQFIASMHFADDLYAAYMANPFPPINAKYYYKHTDTQSIYYLSPEASVISPALMNKYGAMILLDEPDTSGLEEHAL